MESLCFGEYSRATFQFHSVQRSGSFQKTAGDPGKIAGVLKERWLKRMGNQPLEICKTPGKRVVCEE